MRPANPESALDYCEPALHPDEEAKEEPLRI
jgi:hypothetical protein